MDWKTALRQTLANCISIDEVEVVIVIKSSEGDISGQKRGFYASEAESELEKIAREQDVAFGFTGTLVSVTAYSVTTEINLPLSQ